MAEYLLALSLFALLSIKKHSDSLYEIHRFLPAHSVSCSQPCRCLPRLSLHSLLFRIHVEVDAFPIVKLIDDCCCAECDLHG